MKRTRRRRHTVTAPPAAPTIEQISALRAAALGLLLAGLTDDGRVGTETDRILQAGANVTAGVLGFMTAHAANDFIHQRGSREAAINAVAAELQAAAAATQRVQS